MAQKSGMSFSDIEPNVTQALAGVGQVKSAVGDWAMTTFDIPSDLADSAGTAELRTIVNQLLAIVRRDTQGRRRLAIKIK